MNPGHDVELNQQICSRARLARDPRFDGKFFIGTLTTKIYCRPMCRSRTSKESNVRYFLSAAAAEEAGFRPCLRCRPERAPGIRFWPGTQHTVSRALQLISETGPEDGGVEALAEHLGIGARHLRRLFLRHLGASPRAVAQTRRLQFAKKLIDETNLPMGEIALASGFGCVRRFNAAICKAYRRAPTQIRRLARQKSCEPAGQYLFRLNFRAPYDWQRMLDFLAARSTPGVEAVELNAYSRSIFVNGNRGYFEVSLDTIGDALNLRVQIGDPRSLFVIIERVRAILDLDADWTTIARTLSADPALASHVRCDPGLRIPGSWSGFEIAIRAVVEQHADPSCANELLGRVATSFGQRFAPAAGITNLFPTPTALAGAELESMGLSRPTADAVRALARAVGDGHINFDKITDPDALLSRLSDIPGIGRGAAQWVAMRAIREPDAFPALDPDIARVLSLSDPAEIEARSQPWRPWRAYAAMYLWSSGAEFTGRRNTSSLSASGQESSDSPPVDGLPSPQASVASIVLQVVKNAHNAYLAIPRGQLERERLERTIVISRHREDNGKGHLFVEDNGIGQSLQDLRRNLKEIFHPEPHDSDGTPRFQDFFSWVLCGAGAKVTIESTVKGVAVRSRLEVDVRRIYERLGRSAPDEVLSDCTRALPSTEECDKRDHGTTLQIDCDRKTEIVNGRELNRLYDLTDPEDRTLRAILLDNFPVPYSRDLAVSKKVRRVYDRIGYIPQSVYVDGKILERRLPSHLTAFHVRDLKIAGRTAAIAWYLYSPSEFSAANDQTREHHVPGPGIQVVKDNIAIGPKNIFSDVGTRSFLDSFIGEVHIISPHLQPDSSGQDLAPGKARDAFIQQLHKFYNSLRDHAEARPHSHGTLAKAAHL